MSWGAVCRRLLLFVPIGPVDLRMPEKTQSRPQRFGYGSGGLFELLRWLVAECRVQPDPVVVMVDELCNVLAEVIQIAVFMGVDLLAFQSLDETLAAGIGLGRQLQPTQTVRTVPLRSSIHTIRLGARFSSWSPTATTGAKIEFTSTTAAAFCARFQRAGRQCCPRIHLWH